MIRLQPIQLTFLEPILKNFFSENLERAFFFSSPAARAMQSWESDMLRRGAGSGGRQALTVGSGASQTVSLQSWGLQLEARSASATASGGCGAMRLCFADERGCSDSEASLSSSSSSSSSSVWNELDREF